MRPVVLYFDDHHDYQARLVRRLHSLSYDVYEVVAMPATHETAIFNALKSMTKDTLDRVTVALLPRHISLETLSDQPHKLTVCIKLCERGKENNTNESSFCSREHQTSISRPIQSDIRINEKTTKVYVVSRFTRASEIDAIIRRHLIVGTSALTALHQHSNSIGTHLSFSHEASTRVTRYVIGKEQSCGHTVIYLPIKPLYKMESRFRRSHGLTIGDLIYRFSEGDIPEISDMGQWLYMHEAGYYTYALPERSDDLITCDIGTLRQITNAWRDYTHTRSQPTTSWIDIEGMPLCKILELAVLCDFIYVDAPIGHSDKEGIARRELGLFMAQLPKECRILELPHGRRPFAEVNHRDHDKESNIASKL